MSDRIPVNPSPEWLQRMGDAEAECPSIAVGGLAHDVGFLPPMGEFPETKVLKCWPPYYEAIRTGLKTFEVRKNDRDFKRGDRLRLREYDEEAGCYTGREQIAAVTYVMPGGCFGIAEGYCVMSIEYVGFPDYDEHGPERRR